jgi:23S rRNA maturation-related 3'-5' exoribonuclease YhaM
MDIYYFHIRDDFGVVEDTEGMEFPNPTALLMEVIRSADEFVRDATSHRRMRLEIVDANGRMILVTPVQESLLSWELLAQLSTAKASGN